MKALITAILILTSGWAQAEVWKDTGSWSNETEVEYQKWMRDTFPIDIFWRTDNPFFGHAGHPFKDIKENPYKGLSVDCADGYCLARVIFAHGKGLPFKMVGSSNESITNRDGYAGATEVARLQNFFRKVIAECDTISIQRNTFLVAPSKIASGDVYRFNYLGMSPKSPDGRHAHIVRNVLPNGNVHFIWASLPGYPRPLAQKIGAPELAPMAGLTNGKVDIGRLGFRRFYQPQDYALGDAAMRAAQEARGRDDIGQAKLLEEAYSKLGDRIEIEARMRMEKVAANLIQTQKLNEQEAKRSTDNLMRDMLPFARRKVAENLVSVEFAGLVNTALRTGAPESVADRLGRMLSNVCNYAKDRAQNVVEGLAIRETLLRKDGQVRCMTPLEDDYYSTPGRDKQMLRVFEELYRQWWGDDKNPGLSDSSKSGLPVILRSTLAQIFPHKRDMDINAADPTMNQNLAAVCKIDYLTTDYQNVIYKGKPVPAQLQGPRSIDLRQLWVRLVNERLSFDPHDPIEQRWGEIEKLYDRSKGYNCVAPTPKPAE